MGTQLANQPASAGTDFMIASTPDLLSTTPSVERSSHEEKQSLAENMRSRPLVIEPWARKWRIGPIARGIV
jgi:hypothetical protein